MLLMFWKGLSVPAGLGPGALGPLAITSSAVTGRMAIPGAGGIPGNSVLLVTNLNPDVSWKVLYVKSLSGGGIGSFWPRVKFNENVYFKNFY